MKSIDLESYVLSKTANIDSIEFEYSFPYRKYHNMNHIRSMLDLIDVYALEDILTVDQRINLTAAIIFHDIFYLVDSPKALNEFLSAERMNKVYDEVGKHSVYRMILSTAFHFDRVTYDDMPTNLLLDFDIYSFSLPYEDFREINHRIAAEYNVFMKADEVLRGRYDFLKSILDKKTLMYRAIHDGPEREGIAYSNIERYLKEAF